MPRFRPKKEIAEGERMCVHCERVYSSAKDKAKSTYFTKTLKNVATKGKVSREKGKLKINSI